jgi:hypothetical protein
MKSIQMGMQPMKTLRNKNSEKKIGSGMHHVPTFGWREVFVILMPGKRKR